MYKSFYNKANIGDPMKLFTLDFPAGYVARLDGYGTK
jgi:hypothetical protein